MTARSTIPDRIACGHWSSGTEITVLGVSPTLIRALVPRGEAPVKHDLSALRAFASTGEPWNPDPWLWLFNVVGEGRRPIINYSGGTEIAGGILMGNPILPLKPTAFSAPVPAWLLTWSMPQGIPSAIRSANWSFARRGSA